MAESTENKLNVRTDNAPLAPKPAAPKQSKSEERRVAAQKEADAPVSNTPDPKSDPELIADAQSPSVAANSTVNRSHTMLFNDSQGRQVHTFHVSSNNFVTNITESQLRSILDKAGYELADVIDD